MCRDDGCVGGPGARTMSMNTTISNFSKRRSTRVIHTHHMFTSTKVSHTEVAGDICQAIFSLAPPLTKRGAARGAARVEANVR